MQSLNSSLTHISIQQFLAVFHITEEASGKTISCCISYLYHLSGEMFFTSREVAD